VSRRVHGNFRSLLNRLPSSVSDEVRDLQNETGKMLLARAYARVPTKTGALRAGLGYSVTPKTLRLRFGILGKAKNRKLFYGRIQEFGRRGRTIIVTRRGTLQRARAAGLNVRANAYKRASLKAGIGGAYKLRIKPMAAKHFVYNATREQIYRPYQKLWGRILHRAAAGAKDS
jgi:hypothetical protein